MKKIRKGKMVYEGFEFEITAVYDEADEWLQPWDEGAELAIVGNPLPRVDGAKRVSGAARFTVDVKHPPGPGPNSFGPFSWERVPQQ